jgi:hypothetical protein
MFEVVNAQSISHPKDAFFSKAKKAGNIAELLISTQQILFGLTFAKKSADRLRKMEPDISKALDWSYGNGVLVEVRYAVTYDGAGTRISYLLDDGATWAGSGSTMLNALVTGHGSTLSYNVPQGYQFDTERSFFIWFVREEGKTSAYVLDTADAKELRAGARTVLIQNMLTKQIKVQEAGLKLGSATLAALARVEDEETLQRIRSLNDSRQKAVEQHEAINRDLETTLSREGQLASSLRFLQQVSALADFAATLTEVMQMVNVQDSEMIKETKNLLELKQKIEQMRREMNLQTEILHKQIGALKNKINNESLMLRNQLKGADVPDYVLPPYDQNYVYP